MKLPIAIVLIFCLLTSSQHVAPHPESTLEFARTHANESGDSIINIGIRIGFAVMVTLGAHHFSLPQEPTATHAILSQDATHAKLASAFIHTFGIIANRKTAAQSAIVFGIVCAATN